MKVVDDLRDIERRFIARSPLLLLATADAEGRATVSPKGDAPGFVKVLDARTLVIPERPGNRLVMGYRNMLENPRAGLIFLIPGSRETLRVDGKVSLTRDPALLADMDARGKPALLAIRLEVERCLFHCGKAFIRSDAWVPQKWPSAFGFSWGAWAKERFGVEDAQAAEVDASILEDEKNNL
jgi:PPOX class probable FMN-dependent enzyme